jgi:arylsulfatase A-like enzyme
LITVDTLRADRLSAYGYTKRRTPTIDSLADQGVRLANAFCDVTWTTPSMASVMTGSYATHHGLRSTYQQLSPENVTLAEVLHEHGYQTGAIVGSFPLDSIYGLDKGFDTYDDNFTAPLIITGDQPIKHVPSRFSPDVSAQNKFGKEKQLNDSRRPDREVTQAAAQWLRQAHSPFFLWVHYFGPHSLPDRRRVGLENLRIHVEQYPDKVAAMDPQIRALLLTLLATRHAADTLIVFHADHGENLGEHHDIGHGRNLYEPVLRIPLIFWYPKKLPARRVLTGMARNVDIFPSVLELAGISYQGVLDGRSLVPAMLGNGHIVTEELYAETEMPRHAAFAEHVNTPGGATQLVGVIRRGIRTADWKFVGTEPAPLIDRPELPFVPSAYPPGEELYDLRHDPSEEKNVAAQRPVVAAALRARLESYAQVPTHPGEAVHADHEAVRERLRVLGYAD